MYEEEIHFGKWFLKQLEMVLELWPWWHWPLTKCPQNQYGSSATQDGCVDYVWGR